MNTKKALISIIILLLIINVILGLYIISIGSYADENITIEHVMSILEQREVKLENRIPKYSIKPAIAIVGENKFTEQSIELIEAKMNGTLYIEESSGLLIYKNTEYEEDPLKDNSRLSAESTAAKFIETMSLNRKEFILDSVVEKANGLYNLKFIHTDGSGNYYFDIFIDMEVGSGGVTSADIMYRDIKGYRSLGEKGVSIGTVLMANITRKNEGTSGTIQSISSGYKINNAEEKTDAIMSWRIRFDDGTERYFEASGGIEFD